MTFIAAPAPIGGKRKEKRQYTSKNCNLPPFHKHILCVQTANQKTVASSCCAMNQKINLSSRLRTIQAFAVLGKAALRRLSFNSEHGDRNSEERVLSFGEEAGNADFHWAPSGICTQICTQTDQGDGMARHKQLSRKWMEINW